MYKLTLPGVNNNAQRYLPIVHPAAPVSFAVQDNVYAETLQQSLNDPGCCTHQIYVSTRRKPVSRLAARTCSIQVCCTRGSVKTEVTGMFNNE